MTLFDEVILAEIVSTLIYTGLGLILLWFSWKILEWLTPFSIAKEIEEDHNTALAIVIAAVFIAISIIIAAVILAP